MIRRDISVKKVPTTRASDGKTTGIRHWIKDYSQDGEVLYEWPWPAEPFCCCAGLDGDHCGDVGLYAGDAGATDAHERGDMQRETYKRTICRS